jgi:hypothetical protein
MTADSAPPLYPPAGTEPLPRCCSSHPDWATLSQHLVDEFPDVGIADIVREVRRAQEAVEQVGLDVTEALSIGELIARQQLLMLAGQLQDVARLDPEHHARGGISRT